MLYHEVIVVIGRRKVWEHGEVNAIKVVYQDIT
jgi:hypothetical protein